MQRQRMRCLYKVASINVQNEQNSAAKIQLKVGISGNFEEVFMIKTSSGKHDFNFNFSFPFSFFYYFCRRFHREITKRYARLLLEET